MIMFINSEQVEHYRIVEYDSDYLISEISKKDIPKVKTNKCYNLTVEENFIIIGKAHYGTTKLCEPYFNKKFYIEMNKYEYEEV